MVAETDWINTLASVGGTVTSVVAVFIAAKAASASDKSANLASQTLHRSAVIELVSECHELIEEELRIKSLVVDLTAELTSLSRFSGSYANSGIEISKKQLEKDIANADEETKNAKALISSPEKLSSASANDIDIWHAKIKNSRVNLRTIRESMVRHLDNLHDQNIQMLERSLNKKPA